MPPYVMVDDKGRYSGMEYEIVSAALEAKGHRLRPTLYPLARLVETLKSREIQGAAPILASHRTGAFLSMPYIAYDNVALVLASSGLDLASIGDLRGHSVMAFQTARSVLGPAFAAATEGNPLYLEEARQVVQVKALFAGRTEIVIGDERILRWYIRDPATGVDRNRAVKEFRLFPPTRYSAAFLDPRLARDFDEGLGIIMRNGVYDRIMARYAP